MSCLHDYVVVNKNDDGQVERCKLCRKRLVTKVDKYGRMDNKKYLEEHIRDFCQPKGRTAKIYEQVYGNSKTKKG